MMSFGSASLSTFLMEVANFFVQVSEFTWMNVYHLEGTFSQHLHSFSGGSLSHCHLLSSGASNLSCPFVLTNNWNSSEFTKS